MLSSLTFDCAWAWRVFLRKGAVCPSKHGGGPLGGGPLGGGPLGGGGPSAGARAAGARPLLPLHLLVRWCALNILN